METSMLPGFVLVNPLVLKTFLLKGLPAKAAYPNSDFPVERIRNVIVKTYSCLLSL